MSLKGTNYHESGVTTKDYL